MSKLTEYLKLIPKGIKNLDKIVKGVYNNSYLSSLPLEQQEEIIIRRAICEQCPFLNKNAKTSPEYLDLVGSHYESSRTDDHCSLCGCPKDIRTASLEKNCGIEDWNESNPNEQMELKWKAYESA
jgi:hypothetical protein